MKGIRVSIILDGVHDGLGSKYSAGAVACLPPDIAATFIERGAAAYVDGPLARCAVHCSNFWNRRDYKEKLGTIGLILGALTALGTLSNWLLGPKP